MPLVIKRSKMFYQNGKVFLLLLQVMSIVISLCASLLYVLLLEALRSLQDDVFVVGSSKFLKPGEKSSNGGFAGTSNVTTLDHDHMHSDGPMTETFPYSLSRLQSDDNVLSTCEKVMRMGHPYVLGLKSVLEDRDRVMVHEKLYMTLVVYFVGNVKDFLTGHWFDYFYVAPLFQRLMRYFQYSLPFYVIHCLFYRFKL
ncbi:hypothetical protein RHMOL_Rhmol10G0022400 [Rhododendron molle]|uniref:Uncharacterized protein n=1 Tax=Rhododendron molle TaxID=49168 RepID=A0ACC0LY76_RHOML|nr:hypothetical protein RHMOL_Rhmol10G0022400 [Rhododendron molle]